MQEEKLAKAMEENKRKKKRAHVLTRRRDEQHLSNYKGNRHIKVNLNFTMIIKLLQSFFGF